MKFSKYFWPLIGGAAAGCTMTPPMPAPAPPTAAASTAPERVLSGLGSATEASFITSPDGSALSILYSTAVLQWLPSEAPKAETKVKLREGRFELVSARPGSEITLYVRGFTKGPQAARPQLRFAISGVMFDMSNQITAEDFTGCLRANLPDVRTSVSWTMILPFAGGEQNDLHLDSIDIAARRMVDALATTTQVSRC
jgi:hypothetical protein